eukprot:TRINITY_DN11779_c0_g1_i2.p1 TRINITY_DN11779_c0_g1~~TRINITY_DN11779_c0_g1_i2.p1  ORF type:complete len:117 (-),score=29.49 TRINITY_DN11779_c0_g1_i2:27-377(-)
MPAILEEEQVDQWLYEPTKEAALDILVPFPELQFYPVTKAVGNRVNNTKDNIKPIKLEPVEDISTFLTFGDDQKVPIIDVKPNKKRKRDTGDTSKQYPKPKRRKRIVQPKLDTFFS